MDEFQDEQELVFVSVFAVAPDGIERGDDARMSYAGRQPRFVDEHPDEVGALCVFRENALDDDDPCESLRASDATEMDSGHAAGREPIRELVPSNADNVSGPRHAGRG